MTCGHDDSGSQWAFGRTTGEWQAGFSGVYDAVVKD